VSSELARLGGVIGAVGLVLLLVGTARERRIAGLAAWATGMVLLALYLAPEGHHRLLAAAAAVGLVLAGVLAWIFVRWPWVLAVAALACAPARIPVHVGDTEANLLLPLYGVVGAAALALAWELFGDEDRARELGRVTWPLAALVGWTGLSLLWTDDLREGAIALLFFWLPFGLLAICLARLPWRRRWLSLLYVQLAAMAVAFATVGIYQYADRNVFWNPKVIVDNAYAPSGWFYRVNSVFYDPSIYGRFLVVAILASVVLVLHRRPLRVAAAAALLMGVTWVGLLPSFSQSSFVALIVGTVIAVAVWWRRRAIIALALTAVVMVAVGASAAPVRHELVGKSKSGLERATGGRSKLVSNGVRVALDHPVVGVGIGSFKQAYARKTGLRGTEPQAAASHDTPITVAAETGLLGLVLLAWLLVEGLFLAFHPLRTTFNGRARLALGLGLAAISVHSLFYNALFEDPLFWGVLGLVAAGSHALTTESHD
jgi:putative inorganic carbon (HCO3(-)) transporter